MARVGAFRPRRSYPARNRATTIRAGSLSWEDRSASFDGLGRPIWTVGFAPGPSKDRDRRWRHRKVGCAPAGITAFGWPGARLARGARTSPPRPYSGGGACYAVRFVVPPRGARPSRRALPFRNRVTAHLARFPLGGPVAVNLPRASRSRLHGSDVSWSSRLPKPPGPRLRETASSLAGRATRSAFCPGKELREPACIRCATPSLRQEKS